MRVVAGRYKGRRLLSPEGEEGIRPTSDKVKEAIFSMIAMEIEGARVVDLFAGSGSLGIEALSRGAKVCCFCDISPESLKLLRENLDKLKVPGGEAHILREDFRRMGARIGAALAPYSGEEGTAGCPAGGAKGQADIVFADPPYSAGYENEILQLLSDCGIMESGGLLVLEHADKVSVAAHPGFEVLREKRYGKTGVHLLRKV